MKKSILKVAASLVAGMSIFTSGISMTASAANTTDISWKLNTKDAYYIRDTAKKEDSSSVYFYYKEYSKISKKYNEAYIFVGVCGADAKGNRTKNSAGRGRLETDVLVAYPDREYKIYQYIYENKDPNVQLTVSRYGDIGIVKGAWSPDCWGEWNYSALN